MKMSINLLYVAITLFKVNVIISFKLTILHTNDLHSRFEETDAFGGQCFTKDRIAGKCYGGVARRATIVKQIRHQKANVVLLDAGDVMTGTLWYDIYKGNATWTMMNELKYDAMTLGNHDFDDGPANTARFLKHLNFSVVMSNVNASKEPLWSGPLYVNYKVLDVGGEMVGIIGYVLSSTPYVSKPGPGPNIRFLREVISLRTAADELRRKGINKIIAVGHSGIVMDKKIAEQVGGVDVVVGGHSNTFLYSGTPIKELTPKGPYPIVVQSNDGSKVPVVQAYAYGVYLGRLDLEFDSQGKVTKWSGQPILLDNSVAKDTRIQNIITSLKRRVDHVSKVKLGRSLVYLNGARVDCGVKECNLGNLVTDSMVFHYANKTSTTNQWTQASIAITTSSSITASIDVLPNEYITYGHTINSLPYRNTIDLVQLTGTVLRRVFEHSVSSYHYKEPQGRFLQVSGIKIKYDISKPTGQRVTSVQMVCSQCREPTYQPLNETALYNVIVSSYMANGGAGFTMIKEKRVSHQVGSARDNEVLANYIKSVSPVLVGNEGRILFYQSTSTSTGHIYSTDNILVISTLFTISAKVCFSL